MRLAGLGMAIGAVASWALAQSMSGLLFGVTAADPLTFVAMLGVLALVALVAGYLPARRASRIDPLIALRAESGGQLPASSFQLPASGFRLPASGVRRPRCAFGSGPVVGRVFRPAGLSTPDIARELADGDGKRQSDDRPKDRISDRAVQQLPVTR